MAQAQTLFLTNTLNGIHNQRESVERRVYLGRDISGGAHRGASGITVADFVLSKGYCTLSTPPGVISLPEEDEAFNKTAIYTATDLSFIPNQADTFDTILLVAYDTSTDTKRLIGYRTLSPSVVIPSTSHVFNFSWIFSVKSHSAA